MSGYVSFPGEHSQMFFEVVEKVERDDQHEYTYGYTDLYPNRKQYDVLGAYPRHWVEVRELTEEEKQHARANATRAYHMARRSYQDGMQSETVKPVKVCKRCGKPIKPQFTYCYRCNNYLQVKARIA